MEIILEEKFRERVTGEADAYDPGKNLNWLDKDNGK